MMGCYLNNVINEKTFLFYNHEYDYQLWCIFYLEERFCPCFRIVKNAPIIALKMFKYGTCVNTTNEYCWYIRWKQCNGGYDTFCMCKEIFYHNHIIETTYQDRHFEVV